MSLRFGLADGGRIAGFDGLRAVAFLLVFVSHKVPSPRTESYGSAGVWLFFVLSGFLITRILARDLLQIEKGALSRQKALFHFYVRRTARIFPVYYAFLGVLTALSLVGLFDAGEPARQISNWLFLANVYVERNGWATDLGHLWSLAVEEQFYLLFAPAVLFAPRRALPWLCAMLVASSVVAHVAWRDSANLVLLFDVNSIINAGLLALGGLAGLSASRPLPAWLKSDLAMTVTFMTVLAAPAMWPDFPTFLREGRIMGPVVALLLVQITQAQGSSFVKALELAPLRRLGLVSYAAYLFHPVIKTKTLAAAAGFTTGGSGAIWIMADLAVTIGLAAASWKILEAPARSMFSSIFIKST